MFLIDKFVSVNHRRAQTRLGPGRIDQPQAIGSPELLRLKGAANSRYAPIQSQFTNYIPDSNRKPFLTPLPRRYNKSLCAVITYLVRPNLLRLLIHGVHSWFLSRMQSTYPEHHLSIVK